jgi:hypothetical protein
MMGRSIHEIQATWHQLWGALARKGVPAQDREDLAQDCCLRMLEREATGGASADVNEIERTACNARRVYRRRRGKEATRIGAPSQTKEPAADDGGPDREAYGREVLRAVLDALTPGERAGLLEWANGGGPKPKIRLDKLRALLDEFGETWVKVAVISAMGVTWSKTASAGLYAAITLLVLLPASVVVAPAAIFRPDEHRVDPPRMSDGRHSRPASPRIALHHGGAAEATSTPALPSGTPLTVAAGRPAQPRDVEADRERQERDVDSLFQAISVAWVDPPRARALLRRFDGAPRSLQTRHRQERLYASFVLAMSERRRAAACNGPGTDILRIGGSSLYASSVRTHCVPGAR